MKILPKSILTVILILIAIPVSAAQITFGGLYSIYSNENLEAGKGIKLSVSWEKLPIYPFASWEGTLLRFGGQEMADINLYGGGFGIEKKGWFGEFGYFLPKFNHRPSHKEALWLEINRVLQPTYYADYFGNTFTYDISGNFGIAFGKTFEIDRWSISIIYRWLKFQDVIMCHFDSTSYWEVYSYRDFSGPVISIEYEW